MQERSYQKLNVWQEAMSLVTFIYEKTKNFPKEELFGLTSQMRRAAVSVPANIAEGYMRNGPKEYEHYLGYSKGSCAELNTYLIIAHNLKYLNDTDYKQSLNLENKVSVKLYALQNSIQRKRSLEK